MLAACLWLALCLWAPAAALGIDGETPPDDRPVGWQAQEKHRSTFDLVSGCLFTIFACTWSVQHLNVPDPRDDRWRRLLRNLKWMVLTILFPELIILHAFFEFKMALMALRLMEQTDRGFIKLPWWLPRGRQKDPDPECRSVEVDSTEPVENRCKWTLTHCFFANMGGFYYEGINSKFPLTALQLAKDPAVFQRLAMTEKQIEDKSKQDLFAKSIATLQILQLILSLVVRKNSGLAISQLEIITLGLAICGVILYLASFYKPQNVNISSHWNDFQTTQSTSTTLRFEKTYDSFWDILMNKRNFTHAEMGDQTAEQTPERIPNDNIPISKNRIAHPAVFLLAFVSGLFGAMHAIAWDFEFPSTVEKILWRTATLVTIASPIVGLIAIPFTQLTVSAGDSQLFMRNCLRLMRELSWQVPQKEPIVRAYEELEKILVMRDTAGTEARQPFVNILSPERNHEQAIGLGRDLLQFLRNTQSLEINSDEKFIQQFELLVNLMEGKGPKRLTDTVKTNLFPRKNLLPEGLNQCLIYLTTILYCLSRLSPSHRILEPPLDARVRICEHAMDGVYSNA